MDVMRAGTERWSDKDDRGFWGRCCLPVWRARASWCSRRLKLQTFGWRCARPSGPVSPAIFVGVVCMALFALAMREPLPSGNSRRGGCRPMRGTGGAFRARSTSRSPFCSSRGSAPRTFVRGAGDRPDCWPPSRFDQFRLARPSPSARSTCRGRSASRCSSAGSCWSGAETGARRPSLEDGPHPRLPNRSTRGPTERDPLWPRPSSVDAIRTPIGRYGGALANVRADDLAAIPIKALMARKPTRRTGRRWTDVILGCANPGRPRDNRKRRAPWRRCSPGSTSRLPGATVKPALRLWTQMPWAIAAAAIRAGEGDLFFSPAGSRAMSRAPFVMGKGRFPAFLARRADVTTRRSAGASSIRRWKKAYGTDFDAGDGGETSRSSTASRASIRTRWRCAARRAPRAAQKSGRLAARDHAW